MSKDAPQSVPGCPDGLTCAHRCITGCWRVRHDEPLTDYGETWTREDRKRYGNVVQDGFPAQDAAQHWGSRADRVLDFLRDYITEHGYPPSMREVGDAVGLTSSSSVAHQLQVLEVRGHIKREPGIARGITILTDVTTET